MADLDRTPLRRTRAHLPRSVRRDAAAAVGAAAATMPELTAARRLGGYVPVAGELDPWCVLAAAWTRATAVYLPQVVAVGDVRTLRFGAYAPGAALEPAAYGVPAPVGTVAQVGPELLDVVLVPLVAFDATGTRAGMGAGFYDRAFAFRRARGAPPLLVGLAYSWQEVEALDPAPWDVRLDVVVTEHGIRRFEPAGPAPTRPARRPQLR